MKDPQTTAIVKSTPTDRAMRLDPVAIVQVWANGRGTVEIRPEFWTQEPGAIDHVEQRIAALVQCLQNHKRARQ